MIKINYSSSFPNHVSFLMFCMDGIEVFTEVSRHMSGSLNVHWPQHYAKGVFSRQNQDFFVEIISQCIIWQISDLCSYWF